MDTMRRSSAGRSLWKKHLKSLRVILVLGAVFIFFMPIGLFMFIQQDGQMPWASAGIMLSGIAGFWIAFSVWERWWEKKNGNNERGARGERAVGWELEKLHVEGFHIFHDYKPEASGNVDHFLVGEGGVFIVETKAWSGEITTDGKEILRNGKSYPKSPIVQAISEACRIRELLKASCGIDVWVQPVVCFAGDRLRVYGKVRNVEIAGIGAVNRSIMQIATRNPDYCRLSASQVKAISSRLSKHLGEFPAASPGNPPEEPSRLDRLWKKPEVFVAVYTVFILGLTFVFADKTAMMLDGVASIYRALGLLSNYYF